ncbi:MAG: hypothetical protein WA902_06345 [Thermosynechococcaceae cyanobacterium]
MDHSLSAGQPTAIELDTLRRQNELILNSVGEGIYGLDLDGNATFVNPAAGKIEADQLTLTPTTIDVAQFCQGLLKEL